MWHNFQHQKVKAGVLLECALKTIFTSLEALLTHFH